MNGDIYVTRNLRGKYVVRVEGQFDTQHEAFAAGRRIADTLDVELTERSLTGRIREKNSYGSDSPDIPG